MPTGLPGLLEQGSTHVFCKGPDILDFVAISSIIYSYVYILNDYQDKFTECLSSYRKKNFSL